LPALRPAPDHDGFSPRQDTYALFHGGLPPAKVVYSLLLSYAWHNNLCFPGQERLAEHMGVNVSTVSRATTELEDCSLIEIERRGQGKTNFYTINFVVKKKPSKA
jgi:hypothetical protein